MNIFIGSCEAADDPEFGGLSIGTPPTLWLGVKGESEEERLARLDAARDILAEYPELMDLVTRLAAEAIEAEAPDLLANFRPPAPDRLTVAVGSHCDERFSTAVSKEGPGDPQR